MMLSIRSWMFACLGVAGGACRTMGSIGGSRVGVSAGDGADLAGRGWRSGTDEGLDSEAAGMTGGAGLGRLGRLRGSSSVAGWGRAGDLSFGMGSGGRSSLKAAA